MRTNWEWENFYVKIIMIIGIVVFFLNFFTGNLPAASPRTSRWPINCSRLTAAPSSLSSASGETMGRRTWRTSRNL